MGTEEEGEGTFGISSAHKTKYCICLVLELLITLFKKSFSAQKSFRGFRCVAEHILLLDDMMCVCVKCV